MASVSKESKTSEMVAGGFEPYSKLPPPTNSLVTSLLTDMYQVSMSYAYWKAGKHDDESVFDLFFRKNPFKGEFTVFAGVEEVLRHVDNFHISAEQAGYLKRIMPGCDAEFFEYLQTVDCSKVSVYCIPEGSVVFPRVPVIKLVGPLLVCQLLETTLLNLTNYASLMTTNAAKFRLAAGAEKTLLEFGLRRAQGPDGAMSASRYSYMGGFDGTSNVSAGLTFGMLPKGTHAHSFVTSFTSLADIPTHTLKTSSGEEIDFVKRVLAVRAESDNACNDGELAAFITYAQAFPAGFLALVDTYDTLRSGVPNFIAVARVLHECGYKPVGIRLDSGDLAYLSKETRKQFVAATEKYGVPLTGCTIVASNDINEPVLHSLNAQGHEIDAFGIGTHLVTCQAQPALGMVYKLVEINKKPRIKLSQDIGKVTIPGDKEAYRLLNKSNEPLLDLLIRTGEPRPKPGERLLCRHPFEEKKRVYVTPASVVPLLQLAWRGAGVATAPTTGAAAAAAAGEGSETPSGLQIRLPSLPEIRASVARQVSNLREDHVRHSNPTPYKVAVSPSLYSFLHDLWMREVPIAELE